MSVITIISIGSRGDVQPYVALGQGLVQAGHSVKFISGEGFEGLVAPAGMSYHGIPNSDPIRILQSPEGRHLVTEGNPIKAMQELAALGRPALRQTFQMTLDLCAGSDLILWAFLGVAGYHVAQKLGVRSAGVFLQPMTPTRYFNSIGLRQFNPAIPGWSKWLSHWLGDQIIWQINRRDVQAVRKTLLGMPPVPFWGDFPHQRSGYPMLYGYSPSVLPAPPDWDAHKQVLGYWFLNQSAQWTPPANLVDFLQSGTAPVYIGLGSMSAVEPQAFVELVQKAVRRAGVRAVFYTGNLGLGDLAFGDDLLPIGATPHDWLFPQMAAVAHHCGAGTTGAVFRAGVPHIPLPGFGDQFFWGDLAYQRGVGTRPLFRKHLTAESFAQALQTASRDSALRGKAQQFAKAIAKEDGVGAVVAWVRSYLKEGAVPISGAPMSLG
ncbi:MAG TPA: glycosyltransferase [Anaerolineales bacterium]|nr:glycosyltransferase [Anaerolineales bacterium]